MAKGDTALGTGSTLTFAGFTGELLSLSYTGSDRTTVHVPHMGTTGAAPRLVSPIYRLGDIVAEVHLKGNEDPDTALAAVASSLVIVLGETSIWTQTAALIDYEMNDPMDDVMTATGTFAVTTKPVLT